MRVQLCSYFLHRDLPDKLYCSSNTSCPMSLACWTIRNVILLTCSVVVRPSDLESANCSSSVNGLDCFENLNKFDYL